MAEIETRLDEAGLQTLWNLMVRYVNSRSGDNGSSDTPLTEEQIREICTPLPTENNLIPIADKDSLGCVKIGDGLNVTEDGVVFIDNQPIYSENETICGVWIDGRSIYRRVVRTEIWESNKYLWLSFDYCGLPSGCTILKCEGVCHNYPYTRFIPAVYRPDSSDSITESISVFAVSNDALYIVNRGVIPGNIYLTVEYVKTTDA